MEAAEMLGVNYKTLVRSLDSGRMSRRMGDAVERLLSPGEDGSSIRSRQRDRTEALETRAGRLEARIGEVDQATGGAIEKLSAALARPGRSWRPTSAGCATSTGGRFGRWPTGWDGRRRRPPPR